MTRVTSMNNAKDSPTMLLLQRLAAADPDFLAEQKRLTSLTHLSLSKAEQTALAQEALAVLRESPDQARTIRSLTENPGAAKNYDGGLLTSGVLVAIVFLLRSHIKINVWLAAMHLLTASKKGMSAHQMSRMLGLSYESAWFL